MTNVIAHEISHSWTGNLVTSVNFEHFWLNEGFTTFIEGKIVGRLDGDLARDFHAIRSLLDLKDCVSFTIVICNLLLENYDSKFFRFQIS